MFSPVQQRLILFLIITVHWLPAPRCTLLTLLLLTLLLLLLLGASLTLLLHLQKCASGCKVRCCWGLYKEEAVPHKAKSEARKLPTDTLLVGRGLCNGFADLWRGMQSAWEYHIPMLSTTLGVGFCRRWHWLWHQICRKSLPLQITKSSNRADY